MMIRSNAPVSGVKGKPRLPAPPATIAALLLSLLSLGLASGAPALAQSSVNPSTDWNANYGFSSTGDRALRLVQSDLIRKAEGDYYDRLSDTYNVTNHVTHHSTTEIGQQTTTVGSINTATNNLEIRGANNRLDLANTSTNSGCLNGSITIDNTAGVEGRTC